MKLRERLATDAFKMPWAKKMMFDMISQLVANAWIAWRVMSTFTDNY